jgi:ABC-type uncharacterized transport system permease subunit
MILASASPTALILAVGAASAYVASALGASRFGSSWARLTLWLAWVLHGLVLLWGLWGESPRFGFAPALSFTAWLAAGIYAVESHLFPMLKARWSLSGLGALAMWLALAFPGNALHATASPWLPLHWALGIASYGLFAAAVVHGWFMTRTEAQIRRGADPHSGVPLLTLERLMFRFVGTGFVLLTATLAVGLLFSQQLYGTVAPFKLDHKTAFSLLSWLVFAILLMGRARFGWRGRRAVRVIYIGSGLLLLAYVGSRFVLEVILGRVA